MRDKWMSGLSRRTRCHSQPTTCGVCNMADPLLDGHSPGLVAVDERTEIYTSDGMCESESRTRLLTLSITRVEDLRRSGVRGGKGPEGLCSDFQTACLIAASSSGTW